jgi:hypothetical protein
MTSGGRHEAAMMGGDAQWARICRSLGVSFLRLRGT